MFTKMFNKTRIFQKAVIAILFVFMGLLLLVTIFAHTRPSGSTRQDMSQAQLMRKHMESGR